MVLREAGQHDLQSQEQSSLSLEAQWRPDSAAEVLRQQVPGPLLLHQGRHGAGSGQGGRRGGLRHGAGRGVPGAGHPVRGGRPSPGLHGGGRAPLLQLQGERPAWSSIKLLMWKHFSAPVLLHDGFQSFSYHRVGNHLKCYHIISNF